jgi:hypothetical protein
MRLISTKIARRSKIAARFLARRSNSNGSGANVKDMLPSCDRTIQGFGLKGRLVGLREGVKERGGETGIHG